MTSLPATAAETYRYGLGVDTHAATCRVPGLMEALIPRKDESSYGSTEEVPEDLRE